MELRHLQYFVAVAEELHFGRAAARLQITQPPLSQQIRQLELEIGVPLLRRSQRRVECTPAGEVFLREARKVLAAVEAAVNAAQRAHRGELGTLAVGFVGSATYDVLPAVLRTYRRRYPGVAVSLREGSTPALVAGLVAQDLDVSWVRPPVTAPDLEVQVVHSAECVLAVPRQHPLARAHPLRLSDLAQVPLVSLTRETWPGLYDDLLGRCRACGFSPVISQEATEFQTVISLVAGGMGVAVVPPSARHLHTRDVVYRALEDPLPQAAMALAWRRGEANASVHAFVRVATEVCRDLFAPGPRW
ncbi:MAG: LysR family transcriptional regulator [Alicyclobacillus sp.]|nr:LysR family transcriptional regulator [Alicyclobacillus sp.]